MSVYVDNLLSVVQSDRKKEIGEKYIEKYVVETFHCKSFIHSS